MRDTNTPPTNPHATTSRTQRSQQSPAASSRHTPSRTVHAQSQSSTTLRRASVSKPAARQPEPSSSLARPRKRVAAMDIKAHPKVKKFASTKKTTDSNPSPDTPATTHPAVAKAQAKKRAATAPKQSSSIPSQHIKQAAIEKSLAAPKPKHKKKNIFKRHPKIFSIVTASIVLFALAGYLLFLNLPSLSVSVAATRAGIAATYPSAKPDGYRFNGPAESRSGEVTLHFSSNTNDTSFTITQTRSSWNSDAVRTMVERDSDGQFIVTQDRGLTLFTYNGNAAWVNRGLLYQISGDARFSSVQIQQIALSL